MQSVKLRAHERAARGHSALCILHSALISGVSLGFAEAGDAVAFFPLAAFFEDLEALKAFEDIAFSAQSGGRAQTAML